jgi:hypothetical protein
MEVSTSGRSVFSGLLQQQWSSHTRPLNLEYSGASDRCRQRQQTLQHGRGGRLTAVAEASRLAAEVSTVSLCNQHVREGYSESRLVQEQVSPPHRADRCPRMAGAICCMLSRASRYSAALLTVCIHQQASKVDSEQPSMAEVLHPFDPVATTADVCVVGCGPAGLALAAELGSHGLSVALIGMLLHHA